MYKIIMAVSFDNEDEASENEIKQAIRESLETSAIDVESIQVEKM